MTAQRIDHRQVAELTEGLDPKVAQMVDVTIDRINSTEAQIEGALQWIASAAERVARALETGGTLSSSGEFGNHPGEIAILSALRAEHYRTLALLLGSETATKITKREI